MRTTRYRLLITATALIVAGLLTAVVVLVTRPAPTPDPTSPSASTTPTPQATASPTRSTPAAGISPGTAFTTTPSTTPASPTLEPSQIPTTRPDLDRPSPSPSASGLSPGGLTDTELVTAAAATMTTWDTAADVSITNGYRRALPLFTDEWDEVFTVPAKPTVSPTWREAAGQKAVSDPAVEIINRTPTEEGIHYAVEIHVTWEGENDWRLQDPEPMRMTFLVAPDGDDFIIRNWSAGMLQ